LRPDRSEKSLYALLTVRLKGRGRLETPISHLSYIHSTSRNFSRKPSRNSRFPPTTAATRHALREKLNHISLLPLFLLETHAVCGLRELFQMWVLKEVDRVKRGAADLTTPHTLTSWCSSPISLVKAALRLPMVGLDTEIWLAGVGDDERRSI
jgi:hypothetical protein